MGGICGKCRVITHGELSPPDEVELRDISGQSGNIRLACRAKQEGDITVTLGDTWTR